MLSLLSKNIGVKSTLDSYTVSRCTLNMSRPIRIAYPGAWYHVMNRGRRAENIYFDKLDYQAFDDLLQEASE